MIANVLSIVAWWFFGSILITLLLLLAAHHMGGDDPISTERIEALQEYTIADRAKEQIERLEALWNMPEAHR